MKRGLGRVFGSMLSTESLSGGEAHWQKRQALYRNTSGLKRYLDSTYLLKARTEYIKETQPK